MTKVEITTEKCKITIEPTGSLISVDSIVKDIIWNLYVRVGEERIREINIKKVSR